MYDSDFKLLNNYKCVYMLDDSNFGIPFFYNSGYSEYIENNIHDNLFIIVYNVDDDKNAYIVDKYDNKIAVFNNSKIKSVYVNEYIYPQVFINDIEFKYDIKDLIEESRKMQNLKYLYNEM